jgi:predicted dehydrogenase
MGGFRWGVLGAARVADEALLPAIAASGSGSVTAIASLRPERAAELAVRHGVDRVHRSYDDLLADGSLDGVYVALPNALHCEWSVRALRAGKHVLCEKPLAVSVEEARRIDATARAEGRLAMEALMYRFDPATRELVESVTRPRYVHAAASFLLGDPTDVRLDPALGGGALLDLGCYAVDAVRWLLGEPEAVSATAHRDGVDRSVAATLGFADGALATIWASFEAAPVQELTVVGADGATRALHRPFSSYFDPEQPDRFGPQRAMVDAFVHAATTGAAAPYPLSESIGTLAVIERIRTSAGLA